MIYNIQIYTNAIYVSRANKSIGPKPESWGPHFGKMPKHSQLRIRSLQICKGFLQLLLQWARKVGLRLRVNAISHTWSVASRLLHTNRIVFWYIVSMNWFLQVIVCSLLPPASFPQDLRLTCAETHFGMLVFAWLMQPKRQLRWNLDWLPTNWCNCRDM